MSRSSLRHPSQQQQQNNNIDDIKSEVYIVEDFDETHNNNLNLSPNIDDQLNTTKSSGAEVVGICEIDPHDVINLDNSERLNPIMKVTPFSSQNFDEFTGSNESDTSNSEKIRFLEKQTNRLESIIDGMKAQILILNDRVSQLEQEQHKGKIQLSDKNFHGTQDVYSEPLDDIDLSKRSTSTPKSGLANKWNEFESTPEAKNSTSSLYAAKIVSPLTHTAHPSRTTLNNNFFKAQKSDYDLYSNTLQSPATHIEDSFALANKSLSTTLDKNLSYKTSLMSLSTNQSLGQTLSASKLRNKDYSANSTLNLSSVNSFAKWSSLSDILPSKHKSIDIYYDEEERIIRMVLYNSINRLKIPNWIEYDYDIDKKVEPPKIKLKLSWVRGYRGRDTRSNLYYLPTGECIYFVASIVVLFNPQENTQRQYLGHTDNIKCIALHPNKLIVASAQSQSFNLNEKRPIVRIWDSVKLSTLRILNFNEDFAGSICCLAFSKHEKGSILAVVDESNEHTITLVDWQKEINWRVTESLSGPDPVLAIEFHPIDQFKLVAVGKSNIYFWDTRSLVMTKKPGLFDKHEKPKYVLCLAINDCGDVVTGDSNGNILVWTNGFNRPKLCNAHAHDGGIFSILSMRDGTYLSGGKDGKIIEWNSEFERTGRLVQLPEHCGGVRFISHAKGMQVIVGTLRNSILMGSFKTNFSIIMHGHAEAISCLAIHPLLNQYLTGGYDEQVHMFDYMTHTVLWSKCIMSPVSSACFSPSGVTLIVGSSLGKWIVLDALSQDILFSNCDGTGTITCIKFSPNGQLFCLGSTDRNIYIYSTNDTTNLFIYMGKCSGHSGPVKELDWSEDSLHIQSQTANFELLTWSANKFNLIEDPQILSNLKWYSHNCTVGFPVFGIWSDPVTSVNYCDKSNNEDLIVSTTDSQNINIFEWPACYNRSFPQTFNGHADKYNIAKFSSDDSRVIAVSSKNCLTTEWTFN